MTTKKAERKKFSVSVDVQRQKMIKDLVDKLGVKQNGIINMAISQLHQQEFPPKK
jgi:hypothetical protein